MGNGEKKCQRKQERFFQFSICIQLFASLFNCSARLTVRRRQRRRENLFCFVSVCVSGACPFKNLASEVLQIRNRCSTPPSSRPGIRLSGERECVFLGCGWKARQEELIKLGEQSDRSSSLTGRRVLIKVRVSRHAKADNEPHTEATACRCCFSLSPPCNLRRGDVYLLCRRPADSWNTARLLSCCCDALGVWRLHAAAAETVPS